MNFPKDPPDTGKLQDLQDHYQLGPRKRFTLFDKKILFSGTEIIINYNVPTHMKVPTYTSIYL